MAEMKFGIDTYVCDGCNAIVVKSTWQLAGKKCPNCGSESFVVRGKFFDQRIYLDGFLAQGDGGLWADWAKDGFLVGEPAEGLERLMQR
jgi:DNA-directed RNA polymerase subunit RPC12/RpoP